VNIVDDVLKSFEGQIMVERHELASRMAGAFEKRLRAASVFDWLAVEGLARALVRDMVGGVACEPDHSVRVMACACYFGELSELGLK
jgi:hypothetical protein